MQAPNTAASSAAKAGSVGTPVPATDPAAQSSNPLVSLPFFASANDFTCGPSSTANPSSQPRVASPEARARPAAGNSAQGKPFSWVLGVEPSPLSPTMRKRRRPATPEADEPVAAPEKPAKAPHPRSSPTASKSGAHKQKKGESRAHNHDSSNNHSHSHSHPSSKSPSHKSSASHKGSVTPSSRNAPAPEGSPHGSVDSGDDAGSHDHSHSHPDTTAPPKRSRNPSRPYARYACIPCRNMKVACDDARPCSRCIRRDRAAQCQDVPGSRRAKPGVLTYDDPQRAALSTAMRGPGTGLSPPNPFAQANVGPGNPAFAHFQSPKQVPIPARPLSIEETRAAAVAAAGFPPFGMHPMAGMAGFNPAMMHPLAYPQLNPMMGLGGFPFQPAFPMETFMPTTMTANWSLNSTLYPAGMQMPGAPTGMGAMMGERAAANIAADAKPTALPHAAHFTASPKSAAATVADSSAAESLSRMAVPPPPPSSFSELLAQADKALGPSAQLSAGVDSAVKAEPNLLSSLNIPSARITSDTSNSTAQSAGGHDADPAAAAATGGGSGSSGIVVPTPKLASKTSPLLPSQPALRAGAGLPFPFPTDASQLGMGSSLWRPLSSSLPSALPNALPTAPPARPASSSAPPASAVPAMTVPPANPGTAAGSVASAMPVANPAMQVNPQLFSSFPMFPPWMAPPPMFFPSPIAPPSAPPSALPTDRTLFPTAPSAPAEARSRTPERDSESLAAVASSVLSPGSNTVVTQVSEPSDTALLGAGPSFEKLRKLNYAGSSNASIQSNAASEGGDETIDAVSSATRSVGQPDPAAAAASALARSSQGEAERTQPSPASSDSQSNGINGKAGAGGEGSTPTA